MVMAEKRRAMCAEIINILFAIDVPFARACRAFDIEAVGLLVAAATGERCRTQRVFG
jgi:hypothetical protein